MSRRVGSYYGASGGRALTIDEYKKCYGTAPAPATGFIHIPGLPKITKAPVRSDRELALLIGQVQLSVNDRPISSVDELRKSLAKLKRHA